jgi:hypothetical protein
MLLFALLLAGQVFAADTRLTPNTIQCVFKNPLEVGASVTGRVGETIPFFATAEWYLFGLHPHYRGSPSSYFISHYRKLHPSFFYARFKEGETGPVFPKVSAGHTNTWRNLAYSITNEWEQTGAGQVASMLGGDHSEAYKEASIVVGIDLFYWDAIHDNCGYGMGRKTLGKIAPGKWGPVRVDTEYQIQRLIENAKASGKVLYLGTLPYERPEEIPINSVATGVQGFWYPQQYSCVTSINATLKQFCKMEDGCYLMDFSALAEKLYRGEKLPVRSEHTEVSRLEARPDGVHLSYLGAKGAAEQMIDLFEAHPPSCGPKRSASGNGSGSTSGGASSGSGGASGSSSGSSSAR